MKIQSENWTLDFHQGLSIFFVFLPLVFFQFHPWKEILKKKSKKEEEGDFGLVMLFKEEESANKSITELEAEIVRLKRDIIILVETVNELKKELVGKDMLCQENEENEPDSFIFTTFKQQNIMHNKSSQKIRKQNNQKKRKDGKTGYRQKIIQQNIEEETWL